MKKFKTILFALSILLCFAFIGCSNESKTLVIEDVLPENITCVEISGYYGGGKVGPRELSHTEIDEFSAWIIKLSLEHRTFDKGKAPNEIYNGGASCGFNINDGELEITLVYMDKAYILYNNEWYEILNATEPIDFSTLK